MSMENLSGIIKVHCGSAHVRGKARKYPYFVASLFTPKARKDGVVTLRNASLVCGPYRSREKCEREAKLYADSHAFQFEQGYGSLHGRVCNAGL